METVDEETTLRNLAKKGRREDDQKPEGKLKSKS